MASASSSHRTNSIQYAENEEHFLRPQRQQSRHQQRVDAEFDKANKRRPRWRANGELSPRRPFRPVLLRNLGIPLVNELWITTSGQKSRGRRRGRRIGHAWQLGGPARRGLRSTELLSSRVHLPEPREFPG